MFAKGALSNGIQFVLSPYEGTQAITALVFVKVGSRKESEKIAGVSHFLEHMMFKGTKKRPSAKKISKTLDAIGAQYNAYTGKEYTGYYIKADSRHTELALDILSDIYYDSIFAGEEIEREKGAIIQEINMYEDNPLRSIDDWFELNLFGKGALGRYITGSIETVSGLKRADIALWHKLHYVPANTFISVAGKMDIKNMENALKRRFDRKIGNKIERRKGAGAAKKDYGFVSKEKIFLKHKQTDQIQMMLGFPAYGYGHKMEQALTLLEIILGVGMSSRLFLEVRERRGLAYLVRAGLSQYEGIGNFYVHAGVDTVKMNGAISVILNELKKIKNRKVSAMELKNAKEQWRGGAVLGWEDSCAQAEWYARQSAFYKKISDPEDEWKKIRAVTVEDIGRTARDILKFERMKISAIGNPKEKIKISFDSRV